MWNFQLIICLLLCPPILQEQYPSIYSSFVRGRGEFVDSLQEGVDKVLRDEEAYFFVETKTGVSPNKFAIFQTFSRVSIQRDCLPLAVFDAFFLVFAL